MVLFTLLCLHGPAGRGGGVGRRRRRQRGRVAVRVHPVEPALEGLGVGGRGAHALGQRGPRVVVPVTTRGCRRGRVGEPGLLGAVLWRWHLVMVEQVVAVVVVARGNKAGGHLCLSATAPVGVQKEKKAKNIY